MLKVLAWCHKHLASVIPFGIGSSLEGHITPISPAISLEFSRMNRILEVYPQDFLVTLEPGVRREELNHALRDTGLFFPVDPGANATLGGMGHGGDGNFHTLIATLPEEYSRAEIFSELLVQPTLELGGTATGEHGVGLVKMEFMEAEHGAALEWMRRIKELFDPADILNPGKII